MLDASRLGGLTMPEKHELVYEIVKGSECGSEILQSWTRKELLHLICAEMGKERKYTGLPKCKMIEHLLRIVATKESTPQEGALVPFVNSTPTNAPSVFRRQRKKEHPLRLTAAITLPANADAKNTDNNRVCKNSACRAILNSEDVFCKRCSCCICYQFDDNKDPSVWLVCSSELLNEDISCGLSCHIECALKHRNAGVIKVGKHIQLDGSYSCASCGRVSGLIGFWKKQLTVAKDARRVDILCYRLSLSQRLLNGTDQFKEFHDIVLKAVRKLEEEVGPINGVSSKMARGIVSRLSTGLEVQKLCAMAIEKAEALLLSLSRSDSRVENPLPVACRLHFEDVSPTSLVVSLKEIDLKSSEDVGYKMWHRKSRELSYPRDLTCILPKTQRRALISNLQPCTEYAFKIVAFTNKGDIGQSEAKCFTKSVEVFRNRESSMIKGVHKKCGNLGMEDFTSTSAKGARENQPNEDDSSFRVRDLGKIWRAAWAQECEANDAFDSSERDIQINQFGFYEKDEACDSDKPFVSKDSKRNSSPTSPLEVSRDDQIGCHLVQVAEPEDDQEESISALDDERFMAGMGLVKMSHACQGSTKDLKKLKNGSRVNKLSKRKRENHSKVTSQKSSYCEHKQLTLHEMDELVPLDCSYPVFPINTCKVECPRSGRLKNTHSNSNGSDSGNWAVQLIRGAPTVDSQTGISRKRSLNTYDNLHGYDGVSQNGGQVPLSDPPDCLEKDFEYSVKIIRWLECRGHIKEEFRKKLLTWFSLRATSQERRIVYAFIETLLDDPASLAEQLVDTFLEIISIKKPQLSNGFCTKLWH